MNIKSALCAIAAACLVNAADIEVSEPYARATPPNTKNSALFLKIKNNSSNNVKLVSANSTAATTSELHTHQLIAGMKKMIQLDSIEVPANGEVELAPGGLHIMLMNIHAPIKDGDNLQATLKFDNGEEINLNNIPAKSLVKPITSNHNQDTNVSKENYDNLDVQAKEIRSSDVSAPAVSAMSKKSAEKLKKDQRQIL